MTAITADQRLAQLHRHAVRMREEKKALEAKIKANDKQVREAMGDAERVVNRDGKALFYLMRYEHPSVDTKSLKEKRREVYDMFLKITSVEALRVNK